MAQSLAIRPLVLRALRQLSDSERKEFCVLYSLTGELNETHQILSALDKAHKLSTDRECLELFIVNLEAIDSRNEAIATIISDAKKEMIACSDPPQRLESLPFPGPAGPDSDGSDPVHLAGVSEPVQEDNQRLVRVSEMVAGNDRSSPAAIKLDEIDIGNIGWQHKRPRLDSSHFSSTAQAPDSTYNSEESDRDEDSDQTDQLPKEAIGDCLKFIEQARKVAMKSDDPHTKVGAIVVSKEGKVIGEGYNYLPREGLPWDRDAKNEEDNKYLYVTHAAVTAIQNAYKDMENPNGGTLYTTLFPSVRDGVFILTSGIAKMVYLEKNREWRKRYHTGATKKLFDGKIDCQQVYIPETRNSLE